MTLLSFDCNFSEPGRVTAGSVSEAVFMISQRPTPIADDPSFEVCQVVGHIPVSLWCVQSVHPSRQP